MSKILAIDFGKRFIGLAISDELQITASPFLTLEIKNQKSDEIISDIVQICQENQVEIIVLGRPRHISGELGKLDGLEYFKDKLQETGFSIDFEDESVTTIEAEKRLKGRRVPHKKWKSLIDAEAACVILESYLKETSHET